MDTPENLGDRVREHGGRMTRQRKLVLETLAQSQCHPTATELYDMVKERMPGISQGTVYRNLNRLQELGYVQELDYGAGASHYDARVEPHYHVRCEQCGRVDDVQIDLEPRPSIGDAARVAEGWRIHEQRVEFTGVCPECQDTRSEDEE